MAKSWKDDRYYKYNDTDARFHRKDRDKHRQEKHLRDALKANNISEIIQLNNDQEVKNNRRCSLTSSSRICELGSRGCDIYHNKEEQYQFRLSQQDVDEICDELDIFNDEKFDYEEWKQTIKETR